MRGGAVAAFSIFLYRPGGSSIVHDLTTKGAWKENRAWLEQSPDRGELVDFFVPWCGHCKSLTPELEAAAADIEEWPGAADKTRIAKVDCNLDRRRCAGLDIDSYPTLLWLDSKAIVRGEFPPGPRKKANLLSYIAEKLRNKVPLVQISKAKYELDRYYLTRDCRERKEPKNTPYYYMCLANQIRNTLIGGPDAINAIDSQLLSNHIVWSTEYLMPPLPSTNHICWVDSENTNRTKCVDHTQDDFVGQAADASRRFANPLIVNNADWDILFQARNQRTKFPVLIAINPHSISDYATWEETFVTVAESMSDDFLFLQMDPVGNDLMKVFDQLGVDSSSLPAIIVFDRSSKAVKFWAFERRAHTELAEWLEQIALKKIKPSRPAKQKTTWQLILNELKFVYRGAKDGLKELKHSSWLKLVAVISAVALGAAIITFFTSDDGGMSSSAEMTTLLGDIAPAVATQIAQEPPASPAESLLSRPEGDAAETREPSDEGSPKESSMGGADTGAAPIRRRRG